MGRRLTKSNIAALVPPQTGYAILWDDAMPGFGVRVTSTGARAYIFQARIKGRSRRLTLGRFPAVNPEIARKKAQKLAGEIANDGDPVAAKARRKLDAVTLAQVAEEYVRTRRRKKDGLPLKDRTRQDIERALAESFPDWLKKPVTSITRDMVRRRYAERVRVSVARAGVAFRYLRALLNFAMAAHRDAEGRPILADNPVRVLSEASLWQGLPARRTVPSPDDLRRWVPAVIALAKTPDRAAGAGKQFPRLRHGELFRDLLLFITMTGCRRGEAMALRVRDVDLPAGVLVFPDTKNRTDHELPVTTELLRILTRWTAGKEPGALVFAGTDGRPATNLRHALKRVRDKSGLAFAPHDLRRLAASTMERLAVPAYTIKAVLNHLPGAADITGGYVVVDRAMKRDAMEKLAAFVLAAGAQGKVVPIARARR